MQNGDGGILEAEEENTNIVQKQIDIVNGDERDRLVIIEYWKARGGEGIALPGSQEGRVDIREG